VMLAFMSDEDPMLAMLKWITKQLMQIEAEAKVGANKNEHNSKRKTQFSSYRPRRFDTKMGTMYLMVPKLRKGGYVPFFVTAKKRSEEALISIIQEAYINGVSTRKIERLAKGQYQIQPINVLLLLYAPNYRLFKFNSLLTGIIFH